MTDPSFAPPPSQLGPDIANTALPTAGLGLTLDSAGKLASTLLTGTIPASLLPTTIARGVASLTYPGGGSLSNTVTVNHGLGATPNSVVVSNGPVAVAGVISVFQAFNIGSVHFDVIAQTVDGSAPAASTAVDAAWIAAT
jgi:hypothetical protein